MDVQAHDCAGGSNFSIPLPGGPGAKAGDKAAQFEDELSRTIVDCEVNSGAWTLMHRYNKAADLLSQTLSVCVTPSMPCKCQCHARMNAIAMGTVNDTIVHAWMHSPAPCRE